VCILLGGIHASGVSLGCVTTEIVISVVPHTTIWCPRCSSYCRPNDSFLLQHVPHSTNSHSRSLARFGNGHHFKHTLLYW